MDDNHDNFMADIIASGTNTIATITDEDGSQADMYLNIPPNKRMPPVSRTEQEIVRNRISVSLRGGGVN
jgi:hypothetical protein